MASARRSSAATRSPAARSGYTMTRDGSRNRCRAPARAVPITKVDARAASADQLTAFELIPRAALDLALVHIPGTIDPLATAHPWYVLLEMSSSQIKSGIRAAIVRTDEANGVECLGVVMRAQQE